MSPTSEGRKTVKSEGQFLDARYGWSVGESMDKFISELGNKKILGAKCPNCEYTYVPPREFCAQCNTELDEDSIIEIPGRGTLVGYTIGSIELDGRGNFEDLDEPKVIGAIKLEGTDSKIFMPIGEIDPEDVKVGMEAEVEWVDEPEGELSDIKYFKPSGGQ